MNSDISSFAGWVTLIACDDDRVMLGYLAGVQYPAYFAWYAICVMCCLVIQQCEYIVTLGTAFDRMYRYYVLGFPGRDILT
ncbi:hypothetical protein Pyn_24088 [Prunus yedoensis var. nudiflora]|uniref:Uncharacterized protein n=1 Tax=Prunus yedoensis var. nudiflora TaxID=2094558 RepID=A0A314Y578_PRUYE|nr:hypothetical protein Pyn_24088 [Prunus yedoensis var. nudiflora]